MERQVDFTMGKQSEGIKSQQNEKRTRIFQFALCVKNEDTARSMRALYELAKPVAIIHDMNHPKYGQPRHIKMKFKKGV